MSRVLGVNLPSSTPLLPAPLQKLEAQYSVIPYIDCSKGRSPRDDDHTTYASQQPLQKRLASEAKPKHRKPTAIFASSPASQLQTGPISFTSATPTMGLFGFFPSEEEKRARKVRAGAVTPTRAERQRCWEARDAYFACLDANNIVDALKEDKKAARACPDETAEFKRDCAAQWVSFWSPLYSSSCAFVSGRWSGRCGVC